MGAYRPAAKEMPTEDLFGDHTDVTDRTKSSLAKGLKDSATRNFTLLYQQRQSIIVKSIVYLAFLTSN